jgi:hypothetical protein
VAESWRVFKEACARLEAMMRPEPTSRLGPRPRPLVTEARVRAASSAGCAAREGLSLADQFREDAAPGPARHPTARRPRSTTVTPHASGSRWPSALADRSWLALPGASGQVVWARVEEEPD